MYFKKAIDDATSEWAQHHAKRFIDTRAKARGGWDTRARSLHWVRLTRAHPVPPAAGPARQHPPQLSILFRRVWHQ